jgi:PAS domain S-box-containing protein
MIEMLQQRTESSKAVGGVGEGDVTDREISVLLNELQIFQLELEMQNDELKASYQMLEAERAKLSGFFNQAPVGYFILDNLGLVEEANQTGADLLQVQKGDLLGLKFQNFISPDDFQTFYDFLYKIQSSSTRQFLEIKLLYKEVSFYARLEGVAISNLFSDKFQYYLTVVDITESRNAQQKLLDTSQRLTMTLKASATGTWTMQLGEDLLFLDDFSFQILDVQPGTFDGKIKTFIDLIHPKDQAAVRQGFLDAVQNGNMIDLEFKILTSLGVTRVIYVQGHQIDSYEEHKYFAGILMDVTEKKKLAQVAENARREKQRLILSTTLNTQEKERNRISIALHDSICQILYGIRLNLQTIHRASPLSYQFGNVNKLLDQAIQETREISYELSPSVLRDFGFKAGIQEMAQRLSVPGFRINTNIETEIDFFDEDKQLYVFRIIQELINNCIKHAEATVAEIRMYAENGCFKLLFSDNGKGFDYKINQGLIKGSGLRSIKNRIFLLNGDMEVESSKNGTTISIEIRYDQVDIKG